MKYRVTKPLPQGQQPGDEVELHEDVAKVFMLVDAVEPVPEPNKPARGTYKRADMRAERSEEFTAAE